MLPSAQQQSQVHTGALSADYPPSLDENIESL
jgi:hypothetical protein